MIYNPLRCGGVGASRPPCTLSSPCFGRTSPSFSWQFTGSRPPLAQHYAHLHAHREVEAPMAVVGAAAPELRRYYLRLIVSVAQTQAGVHVQEHAAGG